MNYFYMVSKCYFQQTMFVYLLNDYTDFLYPNELRVYIRVETINLLFESFSRNYFTQQQYTYNSSLKVARLLFSFFKSFIKIYYKFDISHKEFFKPPIPQRYFSKQSPNYQVFRSTIIFYFQVMQDPNWYKTTIKNLLKPKSEWIKDEDVTSCFACAKQFRPIVRWRHHCRFCGNIFCSKCAQSIIKGEDIQYKQQKRLRHCLKCHDKIQAILKSGPRDNNRKSQSYSESNIDINLLLNQEFEGSAEYSQLQYANTEEDRKIMKVMNMINNHFMEELEKIVCRICQKYEIQVQTWGKRLSELAIKTVNEVRVDTYIISDYFDLSKEIKITTIVTPKDCVTAVCVKGLILQKNLPSKLLPPHIKFPNVLSFRPAIEAESLLNTNEMRFDTMVKNENTILKTYLQKVYKFKPNIIFVAEHVSKVAFQQLTSNQIIVISKVKPQQLQKIQKLASIKKRIDNLQFIDKYRLQDILGNFQKVYFKTIKPGEMIMILQKDIGIRSVLLGDWNEEINSKLKMIFAIILKIAWTFKKSRELIYKDQQIHLSCSNVKNLALFKNITTKMIHLDNLSHFYCVRGAKIIYRRYTFQQMSKAQQHYCIRSNLTQYLAIPKQPQYFQKIYYEGQDLLLGTYLLKCLSQSFQDPSTYINKIQRYFIQSYFVSISFKQIENIDPTLQKYIQVEEQQEEGRYYSPWKAQNIKIYQKIVNFTQKKRQKIVFMYMLKCKACGQIFENPKLKLGKQYLSINLMHFLSQIIQLYKQTPYPDTNISVENECPHAHSVRIIQSDRLNIVMEVHPFNHYQISPIIFNEAMQKLAEDKEKIYVNQIFQLEFEQKQNIIDQLDKELHRMPFIGSVTSTFATTISGVQSFDHAHYQYFIKIRRILSQLQAYLQSIQNEINQSTGNSSLDWTILTRKFYKIQIALKALYQSTSFISHSLRKQKIQQISSIGQDSNIVYNDQLQIKKRPRLQSEQIDLTQPSSTPKVKFKSIQSMASLISSTRKQSFILQKQEMQSIIFRKSKFYRYPQYRGVHLYFPIANLNDPVSLLACCLNSQEFGEHLNEKVYKDFINFKMGFNKALETQWESYTESNRIFQALFKQQFQKNSISQCNFSIYYHRQFEQLRIQQGIDFPTYIRSLYGCQSWDSSGGKSNSSFSKSHNQLLVVKIINQKQFVQFQKFALGYLKYMRVKREKQEHSYLAKIYGIYQANIRNKIYKFVVMQNIFFGLSGSLTVYDLKGSEVNRLAPASDKPYTRLDTNFIIDKAGKPYVLQESVYDKTIKIFDDDACFLRDQGVIDYSLLVIEQGNTLRMGIIDFMRPYHLIEKIETLYKEIKSGKDPTVIPPPQYSERFINAMKKYFIKVPSIF